MKRYDLYFLRSDGRIGHILPVDGADDEEAERLLMNHRHAHPIELWEGGRLVGRYEAVDGAPPRRIE